VEPDNAIDYPRLPAPSVTRAVLRVSLLVGLFILINTLLNAVVAEKTLFLYKEEMHLTATKVTLLNILLAIPAYMQPLLGGWTELIPWLGYHRRSYFCLGVLIYALGYIPLALLRQYHYAVVLGLLLTTGMGYQLILIVYQGVKIEMGNQTGAFARLHSLVMFLPLVMRVLYTGHLGGYVAEHWTYPRTFGTAALLVLCFLPLVFLIQERRLHTDKPDQEVPAPKGEETDESGAAWIRESHKARRDRDRAKRIEKKTLLLKAIRSPGFWVVVAFFGFVAITPSPDTARTFFFADALHLSKQFIGDLTMYMAAGTLTGLLLLMLALHHLQVRVLAFGYAMSNCLLYMSYLLIHDALSARIGMFSFGFAAAAAGLFGATLTARACPPGIEATVWGIIDSCCIFFYVFCDLWGSWMYDFFGPNNKAHHYTIIHGWYVSVWVGLLFAAMAFLFLPFFPAWARTKESLTAKTVPEMA
jgi:hypothetical protein